MRFAPSDASRLLQAADLVAYVHNQSTRTDLTGIRADTWRRRLWGVLYPDMVREASCWPA